EIADAGHGLSSLGARVVTRVRCPGAGQALTGPRARSSYAGFGEGTASMAITRGFFGRRQPDEVAKRLPPGQYLEHASPVLSAGPTPMVNKEDWKFTVKVGPRPVKTWTWDEFNALPVTDLKRDIHCVTKWTKFDTEWQGVLFDDILKAAGIAEPPTPWILAHS